MFKSYLMIYKIMITCMHKPIYTKTIMSAYDVQAKIVLQ